MGTFANKKSAPDLQKDADGMPYALSVHEVRKIFGRFKALDGVSFDVPQGAFLSIFGPNGAGKTTLLRILSTLSRPTSGSVSVMGHAINDDPEAVRRSIGLISHNSMLYADLTAEQNLMLAAELYGVQNPRARVAELLEAVELSHRSMDLAGTFSRGMSQRLSIARALIHNPDLVFLDEPYSGLDPHAVDIFDELIDKVRAERTFVMVSHDLKKGFDVCTHALVLARGKTVVFAPKSDIDEDAFVRVYKETVGMGVA